MAPKTKSRKMPSASAIDYADDTSSYLFLSQKAAADAAATEAATHVEPSKSNKNKKPKSKQQRHQRTSTSTGKKMQKKRVVLAKDIFNNLSDIVSVSKKSLVLPSSSSSTQLGSTAAAAEDNMKKGSIRHRMTSKMMKLPGRIHHRRSPSLATATTDTDITFVTHESSESASGIDVSLDALPPVITEDDARSLGTSGTTATGATAQAGNLTTNANNGINSSIGPCVLSTILDVSVDLSKDGNSDDDDSCDDDFDDEDPVIIAGSRSVTIDYVFQELKISPNATRRRKHYRGVSGSNSRDCQDKGRGALAKSSIFVNHTTAAGSPHTALADAHVSPGAPPPISLARPVISSSFTPKVVEVPIVATNDGNEWERGQQQERAGVLERFLDRFSCGSGCDSAYSVYEM